MDVWRQKWAVLAAAIGMVGISSVARAADQPIVKYKGKTYTAKDLTPAQQQKMHDIESEAATRLKTFADDVIISRYFDDEAARSGKTRAEVEATALHVPEATEEETKKWYEENKARLPPTYKYEQVVGEIHHFLREAGLRKKREELVAKLKGDGTAVILVQDPVGPVFKIATEGLPVRGKAGAKVTIVEFADYQCPHCKAAKPVVEKVLNKYEGKVNLVFMDFPINPSGISRKVAQGAVCANEQGKFWEYHDLAYERQSTFEPEAATKLAQELKLDEAKFKSCLGTDATAQRVAKSQAEGERLGVGGTPTIFVNGQKVAEHGEDQLSRAIEAALKKGNAT